MTAIFDDDEALLLPQEAADYLRMKLQTLANWRCYGGGPKFTRVGNRIFYPVRNLREFVRFYTCTSDYGKPPPGDGKPAYPAADRSTGRRPMGGTAFFISSHQSTLRGRLGVIACNPKRTNITSRSMRG